MRICELWRYPVKSMQGHRLDVAEIGEAGIVGDRQWALRDTTTGLTLTARRVPELLVATPHVDGEGVVIGLPDGTLTADDAVLSRWLGRDVALCRAGVSATYEIAVDFEDESSSEWVRWEGPSWSFHDSTRTQVSIVSTGSMGDWQHRRFRPNVVVEADDGSEDSLIGHRVQAGSAVVEIVKPIDRCVITTRAQPGVERDLDVLRRINADRGSLLGVGGLVRASGRVGIGDEVRVIESGPSGGPSHD